MGLFESGGLCASALTFMKTIYLFCFWFSSTLWIVAMEGPCLLLKSTWNILFLKHDLAETHESQSSPGSFWKSGGCRGGGATPRRDHRSLSPADGHPWSLPDFHENYLFILFLIFMDDLANPLEVFHSWSLYEFSKNIVQLLFFMERGDLVEVRRGLNSGRGAPVFRGDFWISRG